MKVSVQTGQQPPVGEPVHGQLPGPPSSNSRRRYDEARQRQRAHNELFEASRGSRLLSRCSPSEGLTIRVSVLFASARYAGFEEQYFYVMGL